MLYHTALQFIIIIYLRLKSTFSERLQLYTINHICYSASLKNQILKIPFSERLRTFEAERLEYIQVLYLLLICYNPLSNPAVSSSAFVTCLINCFFTRGQYISA
jgi:hypothetical protein